MFVYGEFIMDIITEASMMFLLLLFDIKHEHKCFVDAGMSCTGANLLCVWLCALRRVNYNASVL